MTTGGRSAASARDTLALPYILLPTPLHSHDQLEWCRVVGSARTIEVLQFDQDVYRSLGVFQGQALLPSRVLADLPVHVAQFFA